MRIFQINANTVPQRQSAKIFEQYTLAIVSRQKPPEGIQKFSHVRAGLNLARSKNQRALVA